MLRKGAAAEEQLEELMIEDGVDIEVSEIQKKINKFVKNNSQAPEVKELKFIANAGLPRDIASSLDIEGRKTIEQLFKILQNYQGLCFKKRHTTMRRMLIFPNKADYRKYMLDMKKLMNEVNGNFYQELGSRVMVRFKGKYVLRIDRDIYEAFGDFISQTVINYKLGKNEIYQINRVDLHLLSSEDTMSNLKDCVKTIMGLLSVDIYEFEEKHTKLFQYTSEEYPSIDTNFGLYPIKSNLGKEFILFVNNHKVFRGKVHLRFEPKTQQLLINGIEEDKKNAKYRISQW